MSWENSQALSIHAEMLEHSHVTRFWRRMLTQISSAKRPLEPVPVPERSRGCRRGAMPLLANIQLDVETTREDPVHLKLYLLHCFCCRSRPCGPSIMSAWVLHVGDHSRPVLERKFGRENAIDVLHWWRIRDAEKAHLGRLRQRIARPSAKRGLVY